MLEICIENIVSSSTIRSEYKFVLPFCVDKIMMEMKHDMAQISKDIVKHKYKFCCDFEKELGMEPSEYSQAIFDYIFNLYNFKKAFGEESFRKNIEEFKDINFLNASLASSYINNKYREFITVYKTYFMDYFGLKYEDDYYIAKKIHDNRKDFKQKLLEYY